MERSYLLKKSVLAFVFILFCLLLTGDTVFAQGGPPPKVKERIGQSNEGVSPFLTGEEIISRFEKDLGVPRDVYAKIVGQLSGAGESSESKHDLTEKPTTEAILTLITTVATVNSGERTGKFKPQERSQNLLGQSDKIIQRRRAHNGWGGLAEEAGLEDPGQLFSIQRAIEFGQPFTPDVKKKLTPVVSNTQTQTAPSK